MMIDVSDQYICVYRLLPNPYRQMKHRQIVAVEGQRYVLAYHDDHDVLE